MSDKQCPYQLDLEKLASTIDKLATVLQSDIDHHKSALTFYRNIVIGLLGVVCVIALGNSALDIGKKVVAEHFTTAIAKQ